MEKELEELYEQEKRLQWDSFCQTEEYQTMALRQVRLYRKMRERFGPTFGKMMEEYNSALNDEWEMECRYFFERGYRLGRKDTLL